MNDPTTKAETYRALKQLINVIIGRDYAKATTDFATDPCERIKECHKLCITDQAASFGNQEKSAQIQRKIDSLNSLYNLARLAEEVEWD